VKYRVEYALEAFSDLESLTPVVRERVISKIDWLAENFGELTPQALTANLSGFFKLRVGDYRVIYEFDRDVKIIFIDGVSHRKDVYH